MSDPPPMAPVHPDVTDQKVNQSGLRESEHALRELNQALERRVKERTAELSLSEAKFRALFERASQGVVLHDENQILEVNPAAVRILGRRSALEVLGKHPGAFSPLRQPNGESSDAMARKYIEETMAHGSARFDWLACGPDGREIPLEVCLTRIDWGGRQTIQAFITDISGRKQAEVELHRTVAHEKELSQLKSSFVSMVSHEFRTPLGIIQSSAELLRDFYQRMPASEREDQLESIIRNTRRMSGMMEEVLVLSRLDAGKLEFRPALLDLRSFCRRVVDEVLSATNHRCPIAMSLDIALQKMEVDERLLGHVFSNLLSNAVKYSELGAPVQFTIVRDRRHVVCVVQDQGIGIPEADQKRLFEAFHRGSNVGTRPGTGLGLLVVKRCTELHDGEVSVQSKVGEGTTVTIKFPIPEP